MKLQKAAGYDWMASRMVQYMGEDREDICTETSSWPVRQKRYVRIGKL